MKRLIIVAAIAVCSAFNVSAQIIYTSEPTIICEEQFKDIAVFCEGLAAVKNTEGLCGYIDYSGEVVIPYQFRYAFNFTKDGIARYQVGPDQSRGFIDKEGNVIFSFLGSIGVPFDFHEGYVIVSNVVREIPLEVKFGIYNTAGDEFIAPIYDDLGHMTDNRLRFAKKNNKFGYINEYDLEIIPFVYDGATDFSEDLAGVILNGKGGYIDTLNNVIIPFEYQQVNPFKNGLAIVANIESVYQTTVFYHRGLINNKGEVILPVEYDRVNTLDHKIFAIRKDLGDKKDLWKYIDGQGNELFGKGFKEANEFSNGLAAVKSEKFFGYINESGEEVIPATYETADYFQSNGRAIVSLKKKYGVIDNQGKEIIPLLYQQILRPYDGYFFVKLKGKWGVIDENGKEILPCIYKNLKYNEGMFCVKEKKLWGVISVR